MINKSSSEIQKLLDARGENAPRGWRELWQRRLQEALAREKAE